MNCRDVQQWILEPGEAPDAALEAHVAACVSCVRFKADHDRLAEIRLPSAPPLDEGLRLRVRAQAMELLDHPHQCTTLVGVPAVLWGVLIAVAGLSGTWAAWTIQDSMAQGRLTLAAILGLGWLIQNGVMLLLAPVLFKATIRPNPSTEQPFGLRGHHA